MLPEACTPVQLRAEPLTEAEAAVALLQSQLAEARAALARERKAREAERVAHETRYQEVLGVLSGYEAALSGVPGASPAEAPALGSVSALIQSLHATIDIQRQALGDDMSVVYYARVVEAAHAYWSLQTEYGRDFQVAPGPSQTDNPFVRTAPVSDKGPWSLFYGQDGRLTGVLSDDFTRDVLLRVDGDFADESERLAYTRWLRDTLIGAGDRTAAGRLDICLKSLHNCYQEFTGICEAVAPARKILQDYVDLLDEHLAKGAPEDSPFHEDRRILAEAIITLGGAVARAQAAPLTAEFGGST